MFFLTSMQSKIGQDYWATNSTISDEELMQYNVYQSNTCRNLKKDINYKKKWVSFKFVSWQTTCNIYIWQFIHLDKQLCINSLSYARKYENIQYLLFIKHLNHIHSKTRNEMWTNANHLRERRVWQACLGWLASLLEPHSVSCSPATA